MRPIQVLVLSLVILATPALAADAPRATQPERHVALPGASVTLSSSSAFAALASRETAGPDTFALYGGPDHPTEGKFQMANGITPDWGGGNGLPGGYGGGPDAWTPVDLTDLPVYWHQSQFNAQTLGTTQPSPNHALWSGLEASDPRAEGWSAPPGYGNNWNDGVIYESPPLADPSIAQTVALDFYFHYDTEPGYDYFNVEYDSAGTWLTVLSLDGYAAANWGDFDPPGTRFIDEQLRPIRFDGNDYGGNFGDQIRIRLSVTSDGAWSNQDGLWPSIAGAAQVDQITLTTSQGSFTEDFETAGPYLFQPDKSPFAGDFADVYPLMTDTDPCRSNGTPVVGFLDYGQVVRNGPGVNGLASTGGSTSVGVQYGIPGNWVFNYSGGLSLGEVAILNEIWSPEIAWDVPGATDDGADVAGAFVRFSVWNHLPVSDGIFFAWHVRSAAPGEPFSTWEDRSFVYHGQSFGYWSNQRFEVSDLLVAGPERVQMALSGWDYAQLFAFPGTSSKPSPIFDNAAFYKYRIGGPTFATRNIDLANDGFPVNGSIDVSSPALRGALDVPFDMARNVSTGSSAIVPGDSVIVDVVAAIPNTTVDDIRMVWALDTNPVFEDALRSAPSRSKDENVTAGPAGTVWTGEVVADTSTTSVGAVITDRFFFDLPDVDFMYPGDVLHYYFKATDSDGRVSTLPSNTTGFGDFSQQTLFSRTFTVRALPSVEDTFGEQPRLLVINDFGRRGGEPSFTSSFQQLGYHEGLDYDTYTVQGPSSQVGNGIGTGGAHGANAQQLSGYSHIFYFAGDLSSGLLSSSSGSGGWNDPPVGSGDIEVLEQWYALPGVRNGAYFGDNIATGLGENPGSFAFLTSVLGVEYYGQDVRDAIGGQTAPGVTPTAWGSTWFASDYAVYGGCLVINEFDWIRPQVGAEAGHHFTDPQGLPYDDPTSGVASVINQVPSGYNITLPYSMMVVQDVASRSVGLSARTLLFQEILGLFNAGLFYSPAVGAPKAERVELSAAPNPFNPVTTVKFTAAPGSRGCVRVFNLRGELVKTLHSGEFIAQEFRWEGTDTRGAPVSSGVYLIRATDGAVTQTQKVALVK